MDASIREAHSGIRILEIEGRLDLNTLNHFKEIVDPLKQGGDLVLNFREVEAVDSSALGYLIRLSMDMEEQEQRLIMVELSELVLHIFELCGLTHRFPIYKTESEALDFVATRASAG